MLHFTDSFYSIAARHVVIDDGLLALFLLPPRRCRYDRQVLTTHLAPGVPVDQVLPMPQARCSLSLHRLASLACLASSLAYLASSPARRASSLACLASSLACLASSMHQC